MSFVDPSGLVDVLFKFETNANGQINSIGPLNHAVLLTEPLLRGSEMSRQAYQLLPTQEHLSRHGSTYAGSLSSLTLEKGEIGYLVHLDPSIFGEDTFSRNVYKPWGAVPSLSSVPVLSGENCASYAGNELNKYLKSFGKSPLAYWELNSPYNLFTALQRHGYVKGIDYYGSFK